jgi:hypothetical protein
MTDAEAAAESVRIVFWPQTEGDWWALPALTEADFRANAGEKLDAQKRQDKSGRTLEGKFLYSVRRSEPPRHLSLGGGW